MKKIHSLFLPAVVAGVATILTYGFAYAQDNAFVVNNGDSTVSEINGATDTVSTLIDTDLNSPTGIAIYDGDIYVANNGNGANEGYVEEYSANGTPIEQYVSDLNGPRGITFDSAGDLFVVNQTSGNVVEIPVGSAADSIGTPVVSGLGTPNAVAIENGTLYVTAVSVHSVSGGVASPYGNTATYLTTANGLAFDSAGNLLVVNHGTSQILKFNSSGDYVGSAVQPLYASSVDGPKDVAIDSIGDFYVTDSTDDTVTEYNSSGALINIFSTDIDGDQAFNGPCFVTTELVVPEPTTYALLLSGLGLLFFFARRKAAMA
jgi:sugar lactone lactonase YvrE